MTVAATSTASASGAAVITSLGIGSGLDVTSIVSQLMAVQNQPVTFFSGAVLLRMICARR